MKKFLVLVLSLLLLLSFTGCGSNEQERVLVDTIVDYYELDSEWEDKIADLFSDYDEQFNKLKNSTSLSDTDLANCSTIVYQKSMTFYNDFDEKQEFLVEKKKELSNSGNVDDAGLSVQMGTKNFEFTSIWTAYSLAEINHSDKAEWFEATVEYVNEMSEFFYGEEYISQSEVEEILKK